MPPSPHKSPVDPLPLLPSFRGADFYSTRLLRGASGPMKAIVLEDAEVLGIMVMIIVAGDRGYFIIVSDWGRFLLYLRLAY